MEIVTGRSHLAAACLGIAVALFSLGTAAERIEQTYVKDNFRTGFKSSVMVGDVPNHEIGQELTISEIRYPNPIFGKSEEWVFNQFDYVDGSGPHH